MIERRGLTHGVAAEIVGMAEADLSALLHGQLLDIGETKCVTA